MKTNLTDKIKDISTEYKCGDFFRNFIAVVLGIVITFAGTDFINTASQEKQIKESMQMIKIELSENLKSINWAEDAYLDEINFFRLLIQKRDSLQTIEASILEDNITAPFVLRGIEYSEDALEVLKNSALMQQISDKGFILKLLQAYKGCRGIHGTNADYYKNKQEYVTRFMSHPTVYNPQKNYKNIYEIWKLRLQEAEIKQLILSMPKFFDKNPFTAPQKAIKDMIELIDQTYR